MSESLKTFVDRVLAGGYVCSEMENEMWTAALARAYRESLSVLNEIVGLVNGERVGHRYSFTFDDPIMQAARAALLRAREGKPL